mgnify:CR=1 FL=1
MATGWGRSTWGADIFGATTVNVSVTGNVGTLSLGSETVTAAANITVTNVVGTTTLDNGTAVQAAAVTGVSAVASASELGDESVSAAANVAVIGNVGTSALGLESLITNNVLDMTGLAGTSALGNVTPKANADVTITEGFELTSVLGTINVWGQVAQGVSTTYTEVSTSQTPNWQEVA